MFDIYDPTQMITQQENDTLKDMTDEERIKVCFFQMVGFLGTMVAALGVLAVSSLLTGCTTPKTIEQHYHHYEQADTLAIQAQIDRTLKSWNEQFELSWQQRIDEYSASRSSHNDQKEHINETITTYIDSLGREVRQEQRTTDRSLSKMQQQTEQRLTSDFELRLRVVIDSINDLWQQRFNALKTHLEQSDSISNFVRSNDVLSCDYHPWYKRCWQSLKDNLLVAAIAVILLSTVRTWLPRCINLFRRFLKII